MTKSAPHSFKTLDFQPDGTFGKASVASFDVRSASGGSSTTGPGGKYELSGNTLVLTHKDGTVQSLTVYPFADKDEFPPSHMGINGSIYKLKKR